MFGVSITLHEIVLISIVVLAIAMTAWGGSRLFRTRSRVLLAALVFGALGGGATVVLAESFLVLGLVLVATAVLVGATTAVGVRRAGMPPILAVSWFVVGTAAALIALLVASPVAPDAGLRNAYPSEARCLAALARPESTSFARRARVVTTGDGRRYLLAEMNASRDVVDQLLCGPAPLADDELTSDVLTLHLAAPLDPHPSNAGIRAHPFFTDTRRGTCFGRIVRRRGVGYYQIRFDESEVY